MNNDQMTITNGTGIEQILRNVVANRNVIAARIHIVDAVEVRLNLHLGQGAVRSTATVPRRMWKVLDMYPIVYASVDGVMMANEAFKIACELIDDTPHFISVGVSTIDVGNYTMETDGDIIQVFSEDVVLQSGEWISYEGELAIKLAEDVIILFRSMVRAENRTDIVFAAITFIKLRCGNQSLTSTLTDKLTQYIERILPTMELQDSEGVLGILRSGLNRIEQVRDSVMYEKLYKMVMYCLSLALLEPLGLKLDSFCYDKVEAEAIKRKYHNKADFFIVVIDTITYLCERGQQALLTGRIDTIFHSGDSYSKFYDEVIRLQHLSKTLDSTVGAAMDPATKTFMADLEDALDKGESIMQYATTLSRGEGKLVVNMVNSLKMIKFERLSLRNALQDRKAPFSLLLYGDSGIGKTSLTNLLFTHFGKYRKLPVGDEFKYNKNPAAKYWDNFKENVWCVVFDDIAFMSVDSALTGGDPTCMELIQVINQASFTPDQAKLEDKGRIACRPDLVLGSTNTKDLNSFWYFSHPTAVNRRFPYIVTPRVKQEYQNENGMLDSSKVPAPKPGRYDDLWEFKIEKVKPATVFVEHKQRCSFELIQDWCDLKTFLIWYNAAIDTHVRNQTITMTSVQNTKDVILCECGLPDDLCECDAILEEQVGEIIRRFPGMHHFWTGFELMMYFLVKSICLLYIDIKWSFKRTKDKFLELLNSKPSEGETFAYLYFSFWWVYWFTMSAFEFAWLYCGVWMVFFGGCVSWLCYPMFIISLLISNLKFTHYINAWVMCGMELFFGKRRYQRLRDYTLVTIYRLATWFPWWWRGIDGLQTGVLILLGRRAWRIMGQRVERNIGTIRALVILSGSIIMCKVFYEVSRKIFASQGMDLQGNVQSVGKKPKEDKDVKTNVWYQNNFELTPFYVSNQSLSNKGISRSEFIRRISKNVVTFKVQLAEKIVFNGAVGLRGHVFITNAHFVSKLPDNFVLEVILRPGEGVVNNYSLPLNKTDFKIYDNDVATITLAGAYPNRDITPYFVTKGCDFATNGYYVGKDLRGETEVNDIIRIRRRGGYFSVPLQKKIDVWEGFATKTTDYGDCGRLLIAETGMGPIILGIHYAGCRESSLVQTIELTRDDVQKWVSNEIEDNTPFLDIGTIHPQCGDLHPRATVRWIESGTCEVYGSYPISQMSKRSQVALSPLAPILLPRGYIIEHGTPNLSRWQPKRIAMMDLVKPKTDVPSSHIEAVVEAFSFDIMKKLDKTAYEMLHVYDMDTAVQGAIMVNYVDKMKFDTSAGYPWNKTKRHLLRDFDKFEFNEEVISRVERMHECYKEGRRAAPIFSANLKDEPLSYAKIEADKVRVMYGCPVDFAIIVRMYFLAFIKLIQERKFTFELAIGTTCQGPDWQNIYDYVTFFGVDNIIAGDFSNYDRSITPNVLRGVFRIMSNVMWASGNYTEEDKRIQSAIWEDTIQPYINFFGDLIRVICLNPSGQTITTPTNSIANSSLVRLAYLNLNPKKEVQSFQNNVHLLTYGDDHIMGVSNSIKTWFNHTAIQTYFKTIGVTYTMAEKGVASEPFINIARASFLKRTFRVNNGLMMCPLEEKSINKMLMVWTHSKTISQAEQAVAVVSAAVQEYFFYGKEVFDSKRGMLKEVIHEAGFDKWVMKSTFPTWETLVKRWYGQPYYPWGDFEHVPVYLNIDYTEALERDAVTAEDNGGEYCYSENGLTLQTYQGAPRNLFLEKTSGWLVKISPKGSQIEYNVITEKYLLAQSFKQIISKLGLTSLSNKQKSIPLVEITTCIHCGQRLTPKDVSLEAVSCCWCSYTLQSGEMDMTMEAEVNVQFTDENGGQSFNMPHKLDPSYNVRYNPSAELSAFLSRPLRLYKYTWVQGSNLDAVQTPWYDYLNEASVKKKIDNYAFFRGTLHLKVVVNASPFYFGSTLVSYLANPKFYTENVSFTGVGQVGTHMARSQRPHVWIYPQSNSGGELVLPFIYQLDWANLSSASDLQGLGELTIQTVNALRSANGATSQSVEVSIFGWLTDVMLSGPTAKLALQSGDEYTPSGVVSRPAGELARLANSLADVPYIGPYAKATSMLSSAVGKAASIFGFTNVPVINDVMPMKNQPFHALASAEISQPIDKLTLDPKQELSIDPRIVGLEGEDDMLISKIAKHESYCGSGSWTSSSAVDSLLFDYYVSPTIALRELNGGIYTISQTPMSYLTRAFAYWSGDIILRFKFICTKYHKGRVLIQWDPFGTIEGVANATNQVYSVVVDISECSDIEFTIPYHQTAAYLKTVHYKYKSTSSQYAAYMAFNGTPTGYDDQVFNGALTVKVLNLLTGPTNSPSIDFQVFARAGDNFKVAYPIQPSKDVAVFVPQSGEINTPMHMEQPCCDVGVETKFEDDKSIFFGENFISIRQLLRRFCLSKVIVWKPQTTNDVVQYISKHAFQPLYYGYDPAGIDEVNSVTTGQVRGNVTFQTYYNWFASCFLGHRGSHRWAYNTISNKVPGHVSATLDSSVLDRASYLITNSFNIEGAFNVYRNNAKNSIAYNLGEPGCDTGRALTNNHTQTGLVAEYPMYTRTRMRSNNPKTVAMGNAYDDSQYQCANYTAVIQNIVDPSVTPVLQDAEPRVITEFYHSVGTDFSFVYFRNVPPLYETTLTS